MTNEKINGLDMGKALEWYAAEGIKLDMPPLGGPLPYSIENSGLIELSEKELGALFRLFPKNAMASSILRKVVGRPEAWFHRDSTLEQPRTTTKREEALAYTAIIPSFTDYSPWKGQKTPAADIWLYRIPSEAASKEVRRIVCAEGFIHEIGHTIIQPLWEEGYKLRLSDGKRVEGFDVMFRFAELSEQHPPISHYASTHRGDDNKFESKNSEYNVKTAISEEMCEAIAAYLLGFVYCGDDKRGKNPFADRPEVEDIVKEILQAERVRTA